MKSLRSPILLAAAFAAFLSASVLAQGTSDPKPPRPHPGDDSITLPDGTVLPPPTINDDGSVTLPNGTIILPPAPPIRNEDGSISLPDGTTINADGTITLPDGTVVDPSKRPPPGARGGHPPEQHPPTQG